MATTVIESLLITLGLDSRNFQAGVRGVERGQRDIENAGRRTAAEEKKNAAEREKALKKNIEGMRKMRNEVLALAAIFTAGVGIKDFITNTINSAVNLGYLSQNLGMSTQQIKAFQLASERAGGSQEGLTAQLKESVDAISELKTGGGPNAGMQAFFRWGGSSKDLEDGNTYLLARAKIIQELAATDPTKATLIAKQMGISEDQYNFIKLGPAAIQDLIAAQERHAAVTMKDAEAALKLKNQMLDLRDSLTTTATRVVLQLAPALEKVFARLEEGANWIAAHKDDIAKWVDDAITAIAEFVTWADRIAESLGGWKNVLVTLIGLKVASFGLSLVSMAGSIALAFGPATAALVGFAAAYAGVRALNEKTGGKIDSWVGQVLEFFGDKGASHTPVKLTAPRSTPAPAAFGAVPPDAQGRLTALESKYGLPTGLLDTIWNTESGRGKNMRSGAGAMGHFQFMPATAKEYGLQNPDDFNESSDAAARKLRDLLKMYKGDVGQAAAAYNWGQGNLNNKGMANAPTETRNYVSKVLAGVRNGGGGGSTTTVNVDNVTIHTQATDAKGIARDMKPALEYSYANNANSGQTQ